MNIQATSEVSFYRDADVVITQSRFITNAKTYAMRNISSVHVFEVVASKKLPVIIGSIGLVVCLASESKTFGVIMLVTGIALFFAIKNSFAVRISTNSGEANSIISKDRAFRVLKSATLSISAIMTFVLGFGLFSAVFVFPLYAQRIIGYSAFQTGTMLLPGTLMAAMVSPFLGRMLQSGLRPQYLIIAGFLFSAIFGFFMSKSNLETGDAYFFIPLIFRGLGAALLIVPLTALAVSELKPQDIPQGAALNNMMRQMGGSFGIALINTYIANRAASNRTALISHVTASDPTTQMRMEGFIRNLMAHGATYLRAAQQALGGLENTVVRQTYLMSYMDAFFLLALMNACCIPLVIMTIKRRKDNAKPTNVVVSDH